MQRNALARLSDVAQSTLPFLARVAHAATRARDELTLCACWAKISKSACAAWSSRYTTLGGDPFGFDPETARQAAMVVAVFIGSISGLRCSASRTCRPAARCLIANHFGSDPD